MLRRTSLALAIAMTIAAPTAIAQQPAAAPAATQAQSVENPFFEVSTLEYHYPRFDLIRNEHYGPAFERGMAEQRAEMKKIADAKDAPTFDNTIVAMEKSGQLLTRVANVFFNLSSTHTNETMQKLQTELAPKLAAHQDEIALDPKLFARVEAVHAKRDQLANPEQKRLVERYYTDFVRAGAKLSEADKAKLKALNGKIASLQTQFTQNVLKATNASAVVVTDVKELEGLSENAIKAAAEAAKTQGKEGQYVIALLNTTGQPALDALKNRALRERLYKASVERATSGEFDNRPVIAEIVKLRAERAKLLGYPNHAAYSLEDQTARTVDAVNKLLGELAPAAVANANREAAEMQKIIDAEGGGFKLAPWDWSYYSEKVRAQKYAFDESQLRPYFEMNNVLENGVFYAAGQLYGLSFKRRDDLPKYHPDTTVYEVFDAGDKKLGIFVADMYARPSKRGGAWMNEYVNQSGLFGYRPVVGNHLNIPKPPAGEPTLLTFDEVTTMFHEFGHALHGLFSSVEYPLLAGTSVPRDFVEYPSQVNEMWATDPAILKNYAKHHETGEPLPQALLDKVLATQTFNQGFATTEYLAAALLDQKFHQITPEQAPGADQVLAFEAKALTDAGVNVAAVPPRYKSTYFSHTFAGGYSAGYYAYIWSEVLDADSVRWFEEKGGLKRENGDHFRKTLLSKGGSKDAMALYRDFRGRDPVVEPLLVRRGLKPSADDSVAPPSDDAAKPADTPTRQ